MYCLIKLVALVAIYKQIQAKYIEGELHTYENWAFLTRFCFLSEDGQFEYHIEFNEDQGDPNLLLYYDTHDQWPAVYKSNKTCQEREQVLNIGQNQIVNLTARYPHYRDFSGCNYLPVAPTSPRPTYTISMPTITPSKHKKLNYSTRTVTESMMITTTFGYTETESTTSSTTDDFDWSTTSFEDTSSSTESNFDAESTAYSDSTAPSTVKHLIKKRSVPTKPPAIRNMRMGRTILCHNARRFRSTRERWWFIAVSNCNGNKGIHLKYKILMTNGAPGDYWHEHLSADEFYILPVLMAFSIAYAFLMLGIVMCSVELKSRQLLHTTYKIFVLSVVIQLFAILFLSISYLKYAVSGLTVPKLKRFAGVLMGLSETLFLLLLLLIAKGFTVTRGRLPLKASIKITIFMCLYIVTYLSIFIYEAKVFDPGQVLYLYESPAGYSLILLRVFAWCMFIYSTIFTLKHYPEKANFYYPFNIFGTLWFIAGPAFILSANTYIDKWVRESVVCAVLLFITFGGHLMFLVLTMPSVANKNFPYHVRTTQIGIMEMAGNAGSSTIEQFSHHVYEPTNTIREQTVIVPLTRRTEEIFEGMYNQRTIRRGDMPSASIQEIVNDSSMENVMGWSMAKNLPALELPNFERIQQARSSLGSYDSKLSDAISSSRYATEEPNGTINENGHFDDYIRDVPIQLFTISKMVVETNHLNKHSNSN